MTPDEKRDFEKLKRDFYFHRHRETDNSRKLERYVYYGQVAANGSATDLPDGWTSSKDATGNYTITHNLNTTRYGVVVTPFSSAFDRDFSVIVDDQTATTFSVNTFLVASPASPPDDADTPFFFILVKRA